MMLDALRLSMTSYEKCWILGQNYDNKTHTRYCKNWMQIDESMQSHLKSLEIS